MRIPVEILVERGDHRAPDFSGGCLTDIDIVLRDTLVVAPIHLRDSTFVRFRQPSGADSVRVIPRNPT